MFRRLQAAVAGIILCLLPVQIAAADSQQKVARGEEWSKTLEQIKFRLFEHYSHPFGGFGAIPDDTKLHVIFDSKKRGELELRFLRDGQKVLSLRGDAGSAFTAFGDRLFFARYSGESPGCIILAYDLTSGKKVWQTELHHAKPIEKPLDMEYRNQVALRMSMQYDVKDEIPGSAIIITGHDLYCDYVEVLDSETGESLALKNYRVFEVPKPENKIARQKKWREVLGQREYYFPTQYSGLLTSLRRIDSDNNKINILFNPKNKWTLKFNFALDNCETLSLKGHDQSSFTSSENVLYFAKYGRSSTGCTIVAYDLSSGETLWETDLHHEKPLGHSGYANLVTIRMSNRGEIKDGIAEEAIIITGMESFCDYIEVLDANTGGSLAVRNYRTGPAPPPPAPPAGKVGGGGF